MTETRKLVNVGSRKTLRSQLRCTVSIAVIAGASLLVPEAAQASCTVGGTTVTCDTTSTTNTTFPANTPLDRQYMGFLPVPVAVTINSGAAISGYGLAVSNAGTGGISVVNNGTISVDAGNTPTLGGSAALSLSATGGLITYTGGGIANNGVGNAFDVRQTGGVGAVDLTVVGDVSSVLGSGITVRDVATSTGISVTAGAVTALTAGQNGIDVQSQSLTGGVTIVANGTVGAGNAGIVGAIFPAAATGNIDVTANGAINARFGVDAENFGTGTTKVTTVGPVSVTSGNGIFALTTGGDVTVNAGNVTSTGNTAIIAQQTSAARSGVITLNAGTVSGTSGIVATNSGTGAITIATTGTVTGTAAEGIKATGNAGVSVTVGNTVTGATFGLSLIGGTGGTGNISVLGAGGFAGGTTDAANILNNGAGTVTVDITGASSSTGGNGFIVRDTALATGVSVKTGSVSALTAGKNGIDVQSQSATGDVTILARGDVAAGNAGIVGAIFPAAATGNIDVTANGAINARFGVDAENFGTGTTKVTTVGPVSVTTGNGIFALTTGGDVTVNAGNVTSTGNTAIIAQQTSAARSGVITLNAGTVSGTSGIVATNSGTGAITIATTGTVTGTAAEGIKATGNAGVGVTVGNTVTGATFGLSLVGGTGGTGNISVLGAGGFAGGTTDAANILNNGAGTVTVDITGASSSTGGNGFIVRDTALATGVSVKTGSVSALTAGKNGIDVQSQSATGDVTILARGDVGAGNAGIVGAIFPAAATGNIDVTANGAINARFGVDAENFGTGTTKVTTVGPVSVTSGNGIFALTVGGDVTVNAGNVTSTGNTAIIAQQTSAARSGVITLNAGTVSGTSGIVATNTGTGAITIATTGTVTGTAAEGIKATGNAGVSVTVGNTVTGATNAIRIVNAGASTLGIGNASKIIGSGANAANATIYIDSVLGTTITVGQGALISSLDYVGGVNPAGQILAASKIAINAHGGAASIDNQGTIVGRVILTDNADSFANRSSNTWVTVGDSNFGAGTDTVSNPGLIVTALQGGVAEQTRFLSLETLVNGDPARVGAGYLSMIDGEAPGAIAANGTRDVTYVSGTFRGVGNSRLGVDAYLGGVGSTSDQLVVGGLDVAGNPIAGTTISGTTSIVVHDVNAGPGAFNPSGILVVSTQHGTIASGAFVIDPASSHYDPRFGGIIDKGLFFYNLATAPTGTGGSGEYLVSVPDQEVLQLPALVTSAQTIWHETSDLWLNHQADVRSYIGGAAAGGTSASGEAPGVWGKVMGSWMSRDNSASYSAGGQTYTYDTSYDQNTYGLVAGVDFGKTADPGAWTLGLMGGYVTSAIDFKQSPSTGGFSGGMFGVYGSYITGGFFVDALVKLDLLRLHYRAPTLGDTASASGSTNLTSTGVMFDTGYQFVLTPTVSFEPIAGISYVRTTTDDIGGLSDASIAFNDGESLRGSIGGRLRALVVDSGSYQLEASATGRLWYEFEGNNVVTIVNPGSPFIVSDKFDGAYGEFGGNLNWLAKSSGWSGFASGNVKFNNHFTSGTVLAGLRYQW